MSSHPEWVNGLREFLRSIGLGDVQIEVQDTGLVFLIRGSKRFTVNEAFYMLSSPANLKVQFTEHFRD